MRTLDVIEIGHVAGNGPIASFLLKALVAEMVFIGVAVYFFKDFIDEKAEMLLEHLDKSSELAQYRKLYGPLPSEPTKRSKRT